MEQMRIHVHVGVHKTATTYVQGVLRHNLMALNEAGVGYVPMGTLRRWVTRQLMAYHPEDFEIEQHLDRFFPHGVPDQVTGLVLSDENLLGDCQTFVRTGCPYPRLEDRLGQLGRLLSGHEVSLFCAIRGYESFPASAYCEGMRHAGFVPFTEFESRIDWQALHWPVILERMERALRPTELRVWRLEDFRGHAGQITSDLAFGQRLLMAVDTRRAERQSFSHLAVDALHAVAERLGQDVASELVRPVSDALPKGPDRPAFTPWTGDRVERLRARYAENCRAIPRHRWVVPPSSHG
ncbi:MAG: hypothetical protein ACRDYU_09280 [Actinomycetes bacterium]